MPPHITSLLLSITLTLLTVAVGIIGFFVSRFIQDTTSKVSSVDNKYDTKFTDLFKEVNKVNVSMHRTFVPKNECFNRHLNEVL